MEVVAALLTITLFWCFVFYSTSGVKLQAHRSAGALLLSLRHPFRWWQIALAVLAGLMPISWLAPLLFFGIASGLGAWSILSDPDIWPMGLFMITAGFCLPPLWLFGLRADTQLRRQGIVEGMGIRAVVTPWHLIKYCKWMKPPGKLLVQCKMANRELRVPLDKVDAAGEILGQFVELRDAQGTVLNPETETAYRRIESGLDHPSRESLPRFRLQFSLRSLLLLVLVASAGFSWLGIRTQRTRAMRAAVAKLDRFGPQVEESGGRVWWIDFSGCGTKPTDDDLVDLKPFSHLKWLILAGAPITDAGLQHLDALVRLESLDLAETPITDAGLEHLTVLGRLESLNLSGTRVTDAGLEHLKTLSRLEHIGLRDTQVTDEGVQQLQQALPDIEIRH